MFTDEQKAQYILMYLQKKLDALNFDYIRCFETFLEASIDDLDLIELVIAKVRIDLITEVEKDIMRFYRMESAPKD